MTRDGLIEENLRDGSIKDISHRSRGRPENKEEFVPERERKKAENEDTKSGKGKRLQMEKVRKSSVRQELSAGGRKPYRYSYRKKKYLDIERNCIVMKKSRMMITL